MRSCVPVALGLLLLAACKGSPRTPAPAARPTAPAASADRLAEANAIESGSDTSLDVLRDEVPAETGVPQAPPHEDAADAADENAAASDHRVECSFEHVDVEEAKFRRPPYKFHGVVPWVKLDAPLTSSCCVLPTSSVLCFVTEHFWTHIKLKQGTMASHYYVEHARLFDKNGRAPWRDVILSVFEPGPMNNPGRAQPPVLHARLETDTTTFRVVATKDEACAPGAALECDDMLAELGGCKAYRRRLASLLSKFCKGRGEHAWRGSRLVTKP